MKRTGAGNAPCSLNSSTHGYFHGCFIAAEFDARELDAKTRLQDKRADLMVRGFILTWLLEGRTEFAVVGKGAESLR